MSVCMASFLILPGCGGEKSLNPWDEREDQLIFTREDGSRVNFPISAQAYVWCGPWETGSVPEPSLHVWFGSAAGLSGWMLKAVVSDIEPGDTMRFPNDFIWNEPDSVHMFLLDPPNELATDMEDSGGFIVFHSLPCPDGMIVDFSIDAVLGSEIGGMPPVAVRGRFKSEITGPLP